MFIENIESMKSGGQGGGNPPEIEFVENIYKKTRESTIISYPKPKNKKHRVEKYIDLILSKPGLSWVARETLLDESLFRRIESFFWFDKGGSCNPSRKNFVNLNQLIIELLIIAGFPEETRFFRPLKTKSRRESLKKYILEALCRSNVPYSNHKPLNEIVLISKECGKGGDEPMQHIYSDKGNLGSL